MSANKTWQGTKVLIDGVEVKAANVDLSVGINELKTAKAELYLDVSAGIKTVKVELHLDKVSQDDDGNITFELIGNGKH